MDPAAEHRQQLRSLRDFLLVYNRMTELCFRHCVCSLNYRLLTGREVSGARRPGPQAGCPPPLTPCPPQESCLDSCAARLVRANHRLMGAYVGLVPALLQRRAAEHAAAAGTAAPPAAAEPAPGPAEGAPAAGT
ncbi:mitochondrial import inner membrane translocase subunit Tim10 B isoform 1-T1 [Ammospiza maritima maritima]